MYKKNSLQKNKLFSLLLFFSPFFLYAQQEYHWNIRQRFELMAFDGRFESALSQTDIEYSPHGIAFITHHLFFLKALFYQDKTSFLDFETNSPILLQQIQNRSRLKYSTFFIAEIYFEQAIIALFKEDLITAAKLLKKAYDYANKSLAKEPDVKEAYRITSLIQIGISTLPSTYKMIANMLGYEADMKKAISNFEEITYGARWLILENKLILYFLYKHFLFNQAAKDSILNQLISIENPPALFLCLKAGDALDQKQPDTALKFLQPYLNEHNTLPHHFPYIYFFIGKSYFLKGDYQKAKTFLLKFLNHYSGKCYVALANLYLGFISLFQNNGQELESYLHATINAPSYLEMDNEAQHLATHILNHGISQVEKQLFKARFLIDGGQFDQALEILQSLLPKLSELSGDEKTILYYYLGRIYHFKNQYFDAKTYYRFTLHQPASLYKWMHAYASYYLGQILEIEEDWEPARRYYRQALSYSNLPYQKSIETYAKAALERLKDKRYQINSN